MKIKQRKVAAALLSGGLLFGSSTCVPDNYWPDLGGSLITSVTETILTGAINQTLYPPEEENED